MSTKFSQFDAGGTPVAADYLVGLDGALNAKWLWSAVRDGLNDIVGKGHRVLDAGTVAAFTGSTSETVVKTVVVPANAMGANGFLIVRHLWEANNNANNKTPRVRFNGLAGTLFHQNTLTGASYVWRAETLIANLNATNVQAGYTAATSGSFGVNAPKASGAIDTTAAVDLVFTAALAVGSDSLQLLHYSVDLVRP